MNTVSFSKNQLKKFFSYATIGIMSACALIGIVMIFVGPETTSMCIISSLLIFYLVTLLTIQNLTKLSDTSITIQTLAVTALVMGIIWAVPWILLVWDAFRGLDEAGRILIWQCLWTAGVVAIFCTVLSTHLVRTRWMSKQKKLFNSIPISIAIFAAFDCILWIWLQSENYWVIEEMMAKFFLAEMILVVLQAIIIQVLSQEQRRKDKQEQIQQEFKKQKSEPKIKDGHR